MVFDKLYCRKLLLMLVPLITACFNKDVTISLASRKRRLMLVPQICACSNTNVVLSWWHEIIIYYIFRKFTHLRKMWNMETTKVFGKNNVSDIRLFESSANCIHSHAILVANKSKIINIITLSVNFMTAFFCCVKKYIFNCQSICLHCKSVLFLLLLLTMDFEINVFVIFICIWSLVLLLLIFVQFVIMLTVLV